MNTKKEPQAATPAAVKTTIGDTAEADATPGQTEVSSPYPLPPLPGMVGLTATGTDIELTHGPHLFRLFRSPTRTGLKPVFVVPVTPNETWQEAEDHHDACMLAIARHVRELTGLEIDPQATELGRKCFLPHDPGLFQRSD